MHICTRPICISHVTHMNGIRLLRRFICASLHTYHMCVTYEWVLNEPCHNVIHVPSLQVYIWRTYESFIRVTWLIYIATWLIHMSDMSDLFVWHESLVCTEFERIYNILYMWYSISQDILKAGNAKDKHTHTNTYPFVLRFSALRCMWHDAFTFVTWPIHICYVTYSYMPHDSFICVTWLIHVRDMTHSCFFKCVIWQIHWHIYDMMHSCVRHNSLICVPSCIHVCDTTYWYVCLHAFMCATQVIDMCAIMHSCVRHNSLICVPSCPLMQYQKSLIHVPCDAFMCAIQVIDTCALWCTIESPDICALVVRYRKSVYAP